MERLQPSWLKVLDAVADGIYVTDRERRILFWNKGAERISGFRRDEVLGKSCADNVLAHATDAGVCLCETQCPLAKTMIDGCDREAEVNLRHKDGHRVPVSVRTSAIYDDEGGIVGAVETFVDRTEVLSALKKVDRLTEQSLVDPLTGVGNRRFGDRELETRFDEMRRYGWGFAMVLCDIDHFKWINDEYGHALGDKVLQMVAKTLKGAVRGFDFLGRWGGEEFLILLPNLPGEEALKAVLERQRALMESSTFVKDGHPIRVTLSFGASIARENDTPETLYRRGDRLLYKSKQSGRNMVTVG